MNERVKEKGIKQSIFLNKLTTFFFKKSKWN